MIDHCTISSPAINPRKALGLQLLLHIYGTNKRIFFQSFFCIHQSFVKHDILLHEETFIYTLIMNLYPFYTKSSVSKSLEDPNICDCIWWETLTLSIPSNEWFEEYRVLPRSSPCPLFKHTTIHIHIYQRLAQHNILLINPILTIWPWTWNKQRPYHIVKFNIASFELGRRTMHSKRLQIEVEHGPKTYLSRDT